MEDTILTYNEVSKSTGIPLGTLYSMVWHKRIPHIRLGRRFVRFSKKEIEMWMNSHKVESEG